MLIALKSRFLPSMFTRSILLCMVMLPCLSGCTALIVGGAAAGGYVVAKDERGAGQIAEDSAISTAVKAKFIADKYVAAGDVKVNTYESVVTLTGDVSSFISREQAQRIAEGVRGVEKVENEIRVVP